MKEDKEGKVLVFIKGKESVHLLSILIFMSWIRLCYESFVDVLSFSYKSQSTVFRLIW